MQTPNPRTPGRTSPIWFPLALAVAGALAFSAWGWLSHPDRTGTEPGGIAAASPEAVPGAPTATPDRSLERPRGLPGSAGIQAFLDPETGELGLGTAEQRRALARQGAPELSYSDEGLRVEQRPDGSRHVNLEGRFQSYSVARIREDGSLDLQCVQGEGAARRLLEESPSRPRLAPPEE